MKKKIIFPLSLLSLVAILSTSCSGSGLTHEINGELHIYQADINHNGKIDDDEKNLTWAESYDKLLEQASSMQELNTAATRFGIADDEVKRTSLARYEILHQAEELLMSTGAIVPLYNYADPYLLHTNVKGIYSTNLGYKFFDQLKHDNGNKDFAVSVGTIATSFDPGQNTDASTAILLSQVYEGAKRWARDENTISGKDDGIYGSHLEEATATVSKKLISSTPVSEANVNDYIYINDCDDLKNLPEADKAKYVNTARWTITLNKNSTWNDGTKVSADDFIYSWNRSSSAIYNKVDFGMWCGLFDCIRGFDAWNTFGQQISKDPETWTKSGKKAWEELEKSHAVRDALKKEWDESFTTNGAKGGMCGVMKSKNGDNDVITVQLINDCEYFEELLAFPALFPVKKSNIITYPSEITTPEAKEDYEKSHICEENKTWWLNKNNLFACNGPLMISGVIDNVEGGGAQLVKNTKYNRDKHAPVEVDSVKFKFIDKDSSMLDSYKSNALDMIDSIPSSVIDYWREQSDWHIADQIGLFYYLFNVNDNTFDRVKGKTEGPKGEENRAKYRRIMNLLINRRDICYNVVKSGVSSADGMVTKGITEKCIPHYDSTKKKIYAKKDNDDKLVTMDWTNRNQNQASHWNNENDPYNKHWLEKRVPQTGSIGGGFYSTFEHEKEQPYSQGLKDKEIEKKSMEKNLAEAYKLAKELENDGAGVKVEGTPTDFHFTQFPKITLSTNNGTGLEDLAERMQSYYNLFGIDMSIETQEWQSFSATRRIGDFAYARHGWVADYNDPRTYLDLCRSTDGNNDSQLGKTGEDAHIHVSH